MRRYRVRLCREWGRRRGYDKRCRICPRLSRTRTPSLVCPPIRGLKSLAPHRGRNVPPVRVSQRRPQWLSNRWFPHRFPRPTRIPQQDSPFRSISRCASPIHGIPTRMAPPSPCRPAACRPGVCRPNLRPEDLPGPGFHRRSRPRASPCRPTRHPRMFHSRSHLRRNRRQNSAPILSMPRLPSRRRTSCRPNLR